MNKEAQAYTNTAVWRNDVLPNTMRAVKRGLDIATSLLILVMTLPALILIALLIKLDSPGPVFFRHLRVGKDGKKFYCMKFRTMYSNSQEVLEQLLKTNPGLRRDWEDNFKLREDPRVTGIGIYLRKMSLDELPQIFNVLAGQMSLVGPRPIVEEEIEKYGVFFNDYKAVLPGITGLWQVSGRNQIKYDDRVRLDSWYVNNWSLWCDFSIIIRTFGAVLRGKGAY